MRYGKVIIKFKWYSHINGAILKNSARALSNSVLHNIVKLGSITRD